MVKPPIVLIAGHAARRRRGDHASDWSGLRGAGQRLYYPPDVAGWDDRLWLDTSTTLGRWRVVDVALAR